MSALPWSLWGSQILAVLRIELRKHLFTKKAIAVYVLALSLVVLIAGHALVPKLGGPSCPGDRDLVFFAAMFQVFFLRFAIFFGTLTIFMTLFRSEMLEKTLHYYFLAPVRREVLVAGKYLAGLATSALVFGASLLVSYLVLLRHVSGTRNAAAAGAAFGDLWPYLGVTLLACAGYGAVFLIMGLYFRNPVVPAVLVLIWESIIIFLPPLLKKISVIFYLESLCPVRVPFREGAALFAIAADPTPAYLAIPGLLLLIVAVLALAGLRIRRMEVSYGTE
jgi:ABC-type transport system involved in multi-copper enzyme maturation permease subunit